MDSIFAQTTNAWEAIIINDGSSDNTEKIAKELAKRDPRIKYITQKNQGLSAARNTGLKVAVGDYLLFLDADDWLYPNCLITYFKFLSKKNDASLLRCGYSYWNKTGERQFHTQSPGVNGAIYPDVLTQNLGPCHSILIRRELVERLEGFDINLKSCEDWDFWIRAGKMGAKIYSIPDVLVAYRYVPTSMSRNSRIMYEALSEVSRRAGFVDFRLPLDAPFNKSFPLDYSEIQKNHLIRMLGVLLYQGKALEALEWYLSEQKKWNWKLKDSDWNKLSTYLSWAYFFETSEITKLLKESSPILNTFFEGFGYSKSKSKKLQRMIFATQMKRRNHNNYGKIIGALLNRLFIY